MIIKIYNKLEIDIESGKVIYEDSFLYNGKVGLCYGEEAIAAGAAVEAGKSAAEVATGVGATEAGAVAAGGYTAAEIAAIEAGGGITAMGGAAGAGVTASGMMQGVSAATGLVGTASSLMTKKPEAPQPGTPPDTTEAAAYAMAENLRNRRGAASTIMTGPLGVTTPGTQQRTTLGA
jgi:hypothetical protein